MCGDLIKKAVFDRFRGISTCKRLRFLTCSKEQVSKPVRPLCFQDLQQDSNRLAEIWTHKGQENKAVQRSGGSLIAIRFDAPAEESEPTGEGPLAATLARSMENHNKMSHIRPIKERS